MTSRSQAYKSALKQTAVYWGTPTPDGDGARTFATAVEIKCRWEQKVDTITTPDGDDIQSNAIVYCNQSVDRGGFLYLGTLADLSSAEAVNPMERSGAYEVRFIEPSPNRDATWHLYKVVL